MKIGIIALSKMDTPFLMELIKKYSNDNYSDIMKVLKYRLETLSLHELLKKCNSESNIILKEMLETAIAEKIKNFELIEDYEKYPSAIKLYLENITSLDAICTLMSMKNQEIKDYLETKYITLIEEYMKLFDDELLYQTEGDDSYLLSKKNNNIIKFPKEKIVKTKELSQDGKCKVYQLENRRNKK